MGGEAALWGIALALAAYERLVVPRPTPTGKDLPDDAGAVSVVVPARNEERGIGRCVASLLGQGPVVREVIVVDDDSEDRTAPVARDAGHGDPRLAVIPAGPLPQGWVGKSWASSQGARHATGEWLLFCDGDVVHAPGTVAAALATAREHDAAGVSLIPRVLSGTRVERWVLPAAVVVISTFVAPGPLVRRPGSAVAIAAGAFILMRRDVYTRIGGHAAMRGHMVDDVTLATRAKRSGHPLVVADGTDLIRLRMYHGGRDLWRGWRKNASFATPGSPAKAVVGAAMVAAASVTPALAVLAGLRRGRPDLLAMGAAGLTAQIGLQRMAGRSAPTPLRDAATLPLGMLVLSAAAVQGAVDRTLGRGAVWRGRRYPTAR